jgi:hypothetical protein
VAPTGSEPHRRSSRHDRDDFTLTHGYFHSAESSDCAGLTESDSVTMRLVAQNSSMRLPMAVRATGSLGPRSDCAAAV